MGAHVRSFFMEPNQYNKKWIDILAAGVLRSDAYCNIGGYDSHAGSYQNRL